MTEEIVPITSMIGDEELVEETPLTQDEQIRLDTFEECVDNNYNSAIAVVGWLKQIHEQRLYRGSYPTFKDYMQGRWSELYQTLSGDNSKLSPARRSQLRSAADIVLQLHNEGATTLPMKESHAAALAELPADKRLETWEQSLSEHNPETITAPKIRKIAEGLYGSEQVERILSKVANPKDKYRKVVIPESIALYYQDQNIVFNVSLPAIHTHSKVIPARVFKDVYLPFSLLMEMGWKPPTQKEYHAFLKREEAKLITLEQEN